MFFLKSLMTQDSNWPLIARRLPTRRFLRNFAGVPGLLIPKASRAKASGVIISAVPQLKEIPTTGKQLTDGVSVRDVFTDAYNY